MNSLIRLNDLDKTAVMKIFKIADRLQQGELVAVLRGKVAVMFFPSTSIRTRVTFEKGINLLGGQSILFPPETLDKKEDVRDVAGYLDNWADLLIIRHWNIDLLDKISSAAKIPVINAMTDSNHPCEILADLYALSKSRSDFINDKYLFCGSRGNIGLAWKEAAEVFNLSLTQCCPIGGEMKGVRFVHDLKSAVIGQDVICTDPIENDLAADLTDYQITREIMEMANPGAVLNPCPPFNRGGEVSEEVINSDYFVGYEFKQYLLVIQQAIIVYCLGLDQ